MRGHLLEEAYEAVEAIDNNDGPHVREELGDVMLLVAMMSQIYSENGEFDIDDVIHEICAKLIRRHPHVFGDEKVHDAEDVLKNWDRIKTDLEGRDRGESVLDGIPGSFPPLERSWKLQKRAAKNGFDWPDIQGPRDKIAEEMEEIESARERNDQKEIEGELGDLLFSVVNFARHLGVDPSVALHRTNAKFEKRFREVERRMKIDGSAMSPANIDQMDAYWDSVKEASSTAQD